MTDKHIEVKPPVEERVIRGLQVFSEALDDSHEDVTRLTIRDVDLELATIDYTPANIRSLRTEVLGFSQSVLAKVMGVSTDTVKKWEQGKRRPQEVSLRFLAEMQSDPAHWRNRVRDAVKVAR